MAQLAQFKPMKQNLRRIWKQLFAIVNFPLFQEGNMLCFYEQGQLAKNPIC
jgi:hypothetical protein